jgi:hypothetical protein
MSFVINPETGRIVNANSRTGQRIRQQYTGTQLNDAFNERQVLLVIPTVDSINHQQIQQQRQEILEQERQRKLRKIENKLYATSKSADDCAICFEPMNDKDKDTNIVMLQNCKHKFHKECIITYTLIKNQTDSHRNPVIVCPLCRTISFGHNAKRKNSKQKNSKQKKSKKNQNSNRIKNK